MTIPQSSALTEVPADSLQDLFSRDPFTQSDADFERIVQEIRAHGERLKAAAANGTRPKNPRIQQPALPVDPDDLGL